jgi:hypothetical protein
MITLHPAPRKTEWGSMMVCADIEIDKDHTLTLYCEEEMIPKVRQALLKALSSYIDLPERN